MVLTRFLSPPHLHSPGRQVLLLFLYKEKESRAAGCGSQVSWQSRGWSSGCQTDRASLTAHLPVAPSAATAPSAPAPVPAETRDAELCQARSRLLRSGFSRPLSLQLMAREPWVPGGSPAPVLGAQSWGSRECLQGEGPRGTWFCVGLLRGPHRGQQWGGLLRQGPPCFPSRSFPASPAGGTLHLDPRPTRPECAPGPRLQGTAPPVHSAQCAGSSGSHSVEQPSPQPVSERPHHPRKKPHAHPHPGDHRSASCLCGSAHSGRFS